MDRRQESIGAIHALPRAHDDEAGQVLILRTEAVVCPRANAGEALQKRATMEHADGALVVGRRPMHGVEKGEIVHAGADVWKEIAHHLAALAVALKSEGAAEDGVGGAPGDVLFFASDLERLAVILIEPRLVIKAVEMREAAVQEEPHNAFCFRCQVRCGELHLRAKGAVGPERLQREPAKARGAGLQKGAAAMW